MLAELAPRQFSRRYGRISSEQIRDGFAKGLSDRQIADLHGCAAATVFQKRCALRLLRRKGGKPREKNTSVSRFDPKALVGKSAKMPPFDSPAITEGRTIYPSTVVSASAALNVLISGKNHWKIGDQITKGRWKGFPVYTLTLEERATCPSSCDHWRSCFGNQMHLARRIEHGAALEQRLSHDLVRLQAAHPGGFAVRLHVLGDFYSVEYVRLWAKFLKAFPALHVFGFSARWQREDPIAVELVRLVIAKWMRFAVRFSNAPADECSTVSIEHPGQAPDDAIICPQQLGKTASCSTCGLCWASRKRIAFIQH